MLIIYVLTTIDRVVQPFWYGVTTLEETELLKFLAKWV
jgi:hypothetical protein